jgi:hypothetical protein
MLSFLLSWSILLPALYGVGVTVVLYVTWKTFHRLFLMSYLSPLRELPRPKNPSLLWGNTREISNAEPGVKQMEWVEKYGPTLVSVTNGYLSYASD